MPAKFGASGCRAATNFAIGKFVSPHMDISSDYLFHFTRKLDSIKGILNGGFRYSYLVEDLPFAGYASNIFDQLPGVVRHQRHSNAVCFCDLPLYLTEKHREQYGHYAVALTKEWGIRNSVTPVRYVHRKTPDLDSDTYSLAEDLYNKLPSYHGNIYKLIRDIMADGSIALPSDAELEALPPKCLTLFGIAGIEFNKLIEFCRSLTAYFREYEGKYEHLTTHEMVPKRFYDEREWRACNDEPGALLTFRFQDIAIVIVETEEEIGEINALMLSLKDALEVTDAGLIATRVHAAKEIYDAFLERLTYWTQDDSLGIKKGWRHSSRCAVGEAGPEDRKLVAGGGMSLTTLKRRAGGLEIVPGGCAGADGCCPLHLQEAEGYAVAAAGLRLARFHSTPLHRGTPQQDAPLLPFSPF